MAKPAWKHGAARRFAIGFLFCAATAGTVFAQEPAAASDDVLKRFSEGVSFVARIPKAQLSGPAQSSLLLEVAEETRLPNGQRLPAGSRLFARMTATRSQDGKEHVVTLLIDSAAKGKKESVPLLAVVQAIYKPAAPAGGASIGEPQAGLSNHVSEVRYTIDNGDGSAIDAGRNTRDSEAEKRRRSETTARMAAAREQEELMRRLRGTVGMLGWADVTLWSGVVDARGVTILRTPAQNIEFPAGTLFVLRAAK